MKRSVIYCLIYFSALNLFGQFDSLQIIKIDSLNKLIKTASHDTIKVKAYIGLSELLYISNPDTDLFICTKVIDISIKNLANKSTKTNERIVYKKYLANAFNNLGFYYFNKSDYDKAEAHFLKSIKYQQEIGDKNGESTSLNNIGFLANTLGDPEKGLLYFKKSLEIRKKIGDESLMANSLNNIGFVYNAKGDTKNALTFFIEGLKMSEKINDLNGMALGYNNVAVVYDDQKDYEKALVYHNKSLEIRKKIRDKTGQAVSYGNIGYIYSMKKEFQKSIDFHNQSLKLYTELENKAGQAREYENIGSIYVQTNELDKAFIALSKGLEISNQINNMQTASLCLNNIAEIEFLNKNYISAKINATEALNKGQQVGFPKAIKPAAFLLYKIYKIENNSIQALKMYELYTKMKDSLFSVESEKTSIQLVLEYEFEKQKALSDIEHQSQIMLSVEKEKRQRVITLIVSSGLLLILILVIIIYSRLKIVRKQKHLIEEKSNQLTDLNEELNQTNEEILAQRDALEVQKQKIEEAHTEIKDSIVYAKRIQNAILPASKIIKQLLPESFVLYKPKDVVAGDFYWIEKSGNTIMFAVADCTGHGVPGAMVSVVCNNALNRSVREFKLTDPGKILDKTREIVLEEFSKSEENVQDGMDIALCALNGNTVHFAGANNPLWIIRNNEIIEIKADKQPIGKFEKEIPFATQSIELLKNDVLYVFTDGYADQFGGEKDKKFSTRQLKQLLLETHQLSMNEQKEMLNSTIESWIKSAKTDQLDDICIFGMKF